MRRIGLIGLGKIARDRHIPTIAAHAAFELVAVADPHGDLSQYGVAAFASHADMLSAVPRSRFRRHLHTTRRALSYRARCHRGRQGLCCWKSRLPQRSRNFRCCGPRPSGRAALSSRPWHSQHNEAVTTARSMLATETVAKVSVIWKEDIEQYHPGQAWLWRTGGFGVFDPGVNALSILSRILPQNPAGARRGAVHRGRSRNPDRRPSRSGNRSPAGKLRDSRIRRAGVRARRYAKSR